MRLLHPKVLVPEKTRGTVISALHNVPVKSEPNRSATTPDWHESLFVKAQKAVCRRISKQIGECEVYMSEFI
eukprot:1146490-Pelagomonas_calceolata.AAC.3